MLPTIATVENSSLGSFYSIKKDVIKNDCILFKSVKKGSISSYNKQNTKIKNDDFYFHPCCDKMVCGPLNIIGIFILALATLCLNQISFVYASKHGPKSN